MPPDLAKSLSRLSQGLLSAIPEWSYLPGFLRQWSHTINMNETLEVGSDIRDGQLVDVMLQPSHVLEKELRFPKAAKANLGHVVDLQMRQSSPAGASNLVWRHRIIGHSDESIQVGVQIVKKSVLKQIETEVGAAGLRLRTVSISGHPHLKHLVNNRRITDRARYGWMGCAVALAFLLVGMMWYGIWSENQRLASVNRDLALQKTELASRAVELRAAAGDAQQDLDKLRADFDLHTREHARLAVILDLTETLSDEVWISEFTIEGAILRISVFSKTAIPPLIANILERPWAYTVDLEGSVSFDSLSQSSRFDLTIGLIEPEGGAL